jgi:lysine N6-hydroxylase
MTTGIIYDIVGVGIGPFNLGLAALTNPIKDLNCLFIDRKTAFNWHAGLMFDDATLQVPFMADLVTMADPISRFSFLNYLKEVDRLYKFYIREDFFILRKEYNKYCQWVLNQLDNCRFSQEVVTITFDETAKLYNILVRNTHTDEADWFTAKHIVLGVGNTPNLPSYVKPEHAAYVCHASDYLHRKDELTQRASVTVIGSGQSAAEVFNDLLLNRRAEAELNWFSRPDRFFPMEYSKLTLELTSPEYVDHYHSLPPAKREAILKGQNSLYKGINYDLINSIYDTLYQQSVDAEQLPVTLSPCSELIAMEETVDSRIRLHFYHTQQERGFTKVTDAVILATGYSYSIPKCLEGIRPMIQVTENGKYLAARNYSIDKGNTIFIQNGELNTHGFVTPDLGMGAYRNASIINTILGYDYYKVEKRIAFQNFTAAPLVNQSATIEAELFVTPN